MIAREILDACCGGRHWWWDKAHPLAVYMDEREALNGSVDHRPNWKCAPDLIGDFRAMPFNDETFSLVLFDPPHIVRPNPSGRIATTFGALSPETEQDDLGRGFAECWRVLAPGGTLVFKWGAGSIKRVEPHFPATPIVGTRSPRGGQTRWFVFYKPLIARRAGPSILGGNLCPACGFVGLMNAREYAHGDPNRYDGVSEWVCPDCGTRVGRWTGRVLTEGMSESPCEVSA